jgi:uncharacterized membrane protein
MIETSAITPGFDPERGSHEAAPPGAAPLFDAILYPHRSLGQTGFLLVMAALCAGSFAIGLAFFLLGAWPVVGFLGLDVLLVYVAFRLNYRAGRAYETLRLTPERLEVTQVDPGGRGRRTSFQPYWLAVDMDDPPRRSSRLTLRSHGRQLEIARFLTPPEKLDLAHALRQALERTRRPLVG